MRNPEDQRHLIAQAVLHVRSQRATSRRELADLMRLSPTTAGQYVDHLIGCGHLNENGLKHGPMGRPKRSLTTNPDACKVRVEGPKGSKLDDHVQLGYLKG